MLRRLLIALVACLLAWPTVASASLTRLADIAAGPPGFCPGPMTVTPTALDIVDACGDAGRIARFSRDGQSFVTTLGPNISASPAVTLGSVRGIAADPQTGARYVSDKGNGRVVRLTAAGQGTAQMPVITAGPTFAYSGLLVPGYCTDLAVSECMPPTGTGPGQFGDPGDTTLDIAVDTSSVLVLDPANHRVQRFSQDLQTFLGAYGDSTVLPNPTAVAVDPVSGDVFVANSQGLAESSPANIVVFSRTGTKIAEIASTGYIDALAVDVSARVLFATNDTAPPGRRVKTFDIPTRSLLRSEQIEGGPGGVYHAALDPGARVLSLALVAGGPPKGWRYAYSPPPVCQPATRTITKDATAAIAVACADADAPELTYAVAFAPEHGTLSGFDPATGTATYTPEPGFTGIDTIGLTARSKNGTSAAVDVTVTVVAPLPPASPAPLVTAAQAPSCPAPALATPYQQDLKIALSCGTATYAVTTPPANGRLSAIGPDGSVTYTPDERFAGEDRFTYTATTANGTSAPVTVTIQVGQALPAPQTGETGNIQVASGSIRYRPNGTGPWLTLTAGAQIPLGSEIDARNGTVGVFVIGRGGQPQSANFTGSIFVVDQKGSPVSTWLTMRGGGLPTASAARFTTFGATAVAAKKRKPKRRLWGDGKGDFRTAGNGSSASVRGTKWLVEDYTNGTRTYVARGVVVVHDRCKRKRVRLTKGREYFARLPKGRKRC